MIQTTSPSGLCGNVSTLGGVLFLGGMMSEKIFKTIDEKATLKGVAESLNE